MREILDFNLARARARTGEPRNHVGTTNTTATATGYPAARAHTHAWEKAYLDAFDRRPGEMQRTDVAFYMQRGMEMDVVVEAIRAAAEAPMPSWRYAVAVMRNCLKENALTLGAYRARAKPGRKKGCCVGPTVSAQDYTQRTYNTGELETLYEDI